MGASDPIVRMSVPTDGHIMVASLAGDWNIERPTPEFDGLLQGLTEAPALDSVGFDTAELGAWDSSLPAFLMQAVRYCDEHDLEFRNDGLPEDVVRLLQLAKSVPEGNIDREKVRDPILARLGAKGASEYEALLAAVTFAGEVAQSFGRLVLLRGRFRWRDFWVVAQSSGPGALPIVTLIAFLIGAITSFLGAVILRRFGAGYYVSFLVGYGTLREMAALMTGIIMAGRTGAAFAAELGSMKVTEEIDALRTLGISPVDHLVLPRVLGLFVMMPLLTIYASVIGIFGGMVVAIALLDLSSTQFFGGLLTAVTLSDALLGVFKGTVFGLIIGFAGCLRGMQTGADARAVGAAATSAVVLGITLIIATNAVIDWLAVLLDI